MSSLSDGMRATLIDVARFSILSAVHASDSRAPEAAAYPQPLRAERASFVSLQSGEDLRGCCGTLEPHRPLVLDVWQSARAAACEDKRFSPVQPRELDDLELEISVLTPLTPLVVSSQRELLATLRPGVDGLYLCLGSRRATFLPKVWESLKEPEQFLTQLKNKAGLEQHFWSSEMQWFRYGTERFGALFATEATCH
jgi:AmmeMemoRadiSam system protein A